MKHEIGKLALGLLLSFGVMSAASADRQQTRSQFPKIARVGKAFAQAQPKSAKEVPAADAAKDVKAPTFAKSKAVQEASDNLGITVLTTNYHHNSEIDPACPQFFEKADFDAWWSAQWSSGSNPAAWSTYRTKAKDAGTEWLVTLNRFAREIWGITEAQMTSLLDWRESYLNEKSYYAMITFINAISDNNANAVRVAQLFGEYYGLSNFAAEVANLGRGLGIYAANATTTYDDLSQVSANTAKYRAIMRLNLFLQAFPTQNVKKMRDFLESLYGTGNPAPVVNCLIQTSLIDDWAAASGTPALVTKNWVPANFVYKA